MSGRGTKAGGMAVPGVDAHGVRCVMIVPLLPTPPVMLHGRGSRAAWNPKPMIFIQNNWLLIVVAIASGALLVWPLVRDRMSPMKSVTTLGATRLINANNPVLLDLRETAEYEGGRIPNSVHIPLSQLKSRVGELAKNTGRPVIAYCARGMRTRSAAAALFGAGFKDVYELNGGLRAWKDAGLPIES